MSARNLTMTVITVFGLLFVIGSGCGDKDKGAQMLAASLKAELDAKQKELDCKVAVLSKTCSGPTATCDKDKTDGLAACSAAAASATSVSTSTGSTTGTATGTTTTSATDTSSGIGI